MVGDTTVHIYCDGSNHNGYGGYGIVVTVNGLVTREVSRPVPAELGYCSNNIAELCAVRESLRLAPREGRCIIRSDSMYAINAVVEWYAGWKLNGWLTSGGTRVANQGLIEHARSIYERKIDVVRLAHVKGHAGDPFNHLADQLAGQARLRAQEIAGVPALAAIGEGEDDPRPAPSGISEGHVRKLLQLYKGNTIDEDTFVDKLNRLSRRS